MLRAGGFTSSKAFTDAPTVVTRSQDTGPVDAPGAGLDNVKVLDQICRIVRRHAVENGNRNYQVQLEVLKNNQWTAVMIYNISDGNCWRRAINAAGSTEVMKLELPIPAIHQMLETDFSTNWQEYRDRFITLK
jgi:hypothetical protein